MQSGSLTLLPKRGKLCSFMPLTEAASTQYDTIHLNGMTFKGYHGCLEAEKTNGQPFVIDLELYLPLHNAGITDNLEHTVNYAAIFSIVQEITETKRFNLIEALAEAICRAILIEFPAIQALAIEVKKPEVPIEGQLDYASVRFYRTKSSIWCDEVYLGLGSNIGDREHKLQQAIKRLNDHPQIEVITVSSFHETKPVGYLDQADFLNAAIRIKTALFPQDLLAYCLAIEQEQGRIRTLLNGPRTLDIDILLYGEITFKTEHLDIPHPRMFERSFVLKPLAEIISKSNQLAEKVTNV